MTVMVYKMIDGTEVIAQLVMTEDDGDTIKNARVFGIFGSEANPQSGLAPFMKLVVEDNIFLKESAFVASAEAPTDVANSYLQTVTGIQIATSLN